MANPLRFLLNIAYHKSGRRVSFPRCMDVSVYAPLQTVLMEIMNKEGKTFLFNDALNTFYLQLYGVRHMVKDHSDSEKGNLLPPYGLLFLNSSKGSFICIIPQTG